jgi:CheY-like chemotaxis protein
MLNGVKRILMIEDDPIVAVVYQRFLAAHGFQIDIARDGTAGLQRLLSYRPDAVLLDLMLPRVNGLGVLAAIRSDPNLAGVPVVVMTAAAVPSLIKMAKDGGAQRIFDKANDKPLAVVNYLHDLLRTTSDPRLLAVTKSGNPDSVLEDWPAREAELRAAGDKEAKNSDAPNAMSNAVNSDLELHG